jgi:hypothetical protein
MVRNCRGVKTVRGVNRQRTVAARAMVLITILGTTPTRAAGNRHPMGKLAATAKSAKLFAAVRTVIAGLNRRIARPQ